MNWWNQVFITFSIIIGTGLGEAVSIKSFGKPSKSWVSIVQVVLFVGLLITVVNSVTVSSDNLLLTTGVFCFLSFLSIIFSSGLVTFAGLAGRRVKKTVLRKRSDESKIIGLYRSLKHKGVSEEDILDSLSEAGFRNADKIIDELKRINK